MPAVLSIPPRLLPWLPLGALAGYALLMATNPVRASLRDGIRALRRYPSLWLVLGLCGGGYAFFHLAVRVYLALAAPAAEAAPFRLWREDFRWEASWFHGAEGSLWYLPPGSLREAGQEAVFSALESTGGLFNNLVSTFPLAAWAAVLLWLNWKGHQRTLFRALRKRFGFGGWLLHGAVLICAAAAVAKPILYFFVPPVDPTLLTQWSPFLGWLSFLFEYSVGVGVQIYLILVAYCWFRGITFTPQHLVDVAIRRFSCVVRWALVVMFLSSVFIDLPLTLRMFAPFSEYIPSSPEVLEFRIALVRRLLAGVLLFFATMQITLTFHSESLGRGFMDHFRFVGQQAWSLLWLVLIAGLHFYGLHLGNLLVERAVGEGTALAIAWDLCFPWLLALLGAWLLASWVGIYRRAENSRSQEVALGRF